MEVSTTLVVRPRRRPRGTACRCRGGSSSAGRRRGSGRSGRPRASRAPGRAAPGSARGSSRRTRDASRRCRRGPDVHAELSPQPRPPRRRGRRAPRCGRRRSRPGETTTSRTPRRASSRRSVADVRLEPRDLRRAAAALVDDRVARAAPTASATSARRLGELVGVAAALGHRDRDAVRGEDEPRARRGAPPGCCASASRTRSAFASTKPGVVVERAQLQHLGRAGADRLLRAVDVLAVLPAARVRAEGRGEERERASARPASRISRSVSVEERVPVAVAEVDRQVDPVRARARARAPRSARGSAR